MDATKKTIDFIENLSYQDLPSEVRHQTKRCLLDTLGAMIAGYETPVAGLMEAFAEEQFPGDQAEIIVSGRRVSASGAALSNGFAANALDIDDGYRNIKGHPGACVVPVVLTAAQLTVSKAAAARAAESGRTGPGVDGKAFLSALAAGYETAIRAGLIRHATYETYHSSGSWGAVGGAAAAGKLLGLSEKQLRNALGAAEYHAPIAPMMKCIEVPGMGKDSIGWGCMVGMMSVLMAEKGFTGINPLFDDTPEPRWIETMGSEWEIMNVYFKPYACCRWAQPAVDGALKLVRDYGIRPEDIDEIRIYTFRESAALSGAPPKNTEEAQYNILFPAAAAVLDGEVGPEQVLPPRLFETDIREMMKKISVVPEKRFQKHFPERAESEVEIRFRRSGRVPQERVRSGVMPARWDAGESAPTDGDLERKFFWLAHPVLGKEKTDKLRDAVWSLDTLPDLEVFYRLLRQKG